MANFSATSLTRLQGCDPRLQQVMNEAIKTYDFTVLQGHRDQAEQDADFAAGKSKLKWPHGKHNASPSKAVDIAPFPIDWNDKAGFRKLAAHILYTAHLLRIPLRWGGNWDKSGDVNALPPTSFVDMPHFEIVDG
jgi:peptidoglycan L-alanyl-D-glutamate endopeptidase CwlK